MMRGVITKFDPTEEDGMDPVSPNTPLKAMVKRQYLDSLARGGGVTKATVRRLEPLREGLPTSPSRSRGGTLFKSEELGRRSLSHSDVQKNSARALNWFRDARRQNLEMKNLSNPELRRSPSPKKKMNLAKMRKAVDCVMVAKHIMHSGVQVGGGAGLAARLKAKMQQQ